MDDDDLLELVDLREEQGDSASKQPDPALETSNVYPFTSRSGYQPYVAHRIKAKTFHLKIRLVGGERRAPVYHHLLDIASNEAGTQLELVFRFLIVRIRGKNMGAIIEAIENHACDFIQEFSPLIFMRPAEDAPIIEEIEFPVPVEDQE